MRYFNTSGPNIPAQHYTLPRTALVARGMKLVESARYFTIWAPRQTGKSTYFELLKLQLEEQGYRVVRAGMEKAMHATMTGLLQNLTLNFQEAGLEAPEFEDLNNFVNFVETLNGPKVVFIIDEIEALNPALFGPFLHALRHLYHSRTRHCLKSVILVGVSNIVGVVEDNASPFNIADNLNVPYFTNEEVYELLGQHESETGQIFEREVIAKIADVTACQPGLVNGFAQQLIERYPDKNPLDMADYLKVEDWYLTETIDKNISNIINKARRYRPFVEGLLFGEQEVPFNINREEIKVLATNGLIEKDSNGNVTFRVPLYRKCLHAAFYPYTNGERGRLTKEISADDYFLPDGSINFPKWIGNYKAWVQRRSFKYFREKDKDGNYLSLKEAALVYSFETYVAAFLDEYGGKSYLEPHVGLGRSDLLINMKDHEYIIEFKVYGGRASFLKGKKQLAYYCQKNGLTQGEYLVFVPKNIRIPVEVNEIPKKEENTGVVIRPWLVYYDEDTDF